MRFTKTIIDEGGKGNLALIDSVTGKVSFEMTGDAIMQLVQTLGEASARSSIGGAVQVIYPNMTKEEREELFK